MRVAPSQSRLAFGSGPASIREPAPAFAPISITPPKSGLNRVGLTLGLCMLFVRVSFIHQLIAYETGVNSRLLYIIGIPILVVVLCTGVLKRTFRGPTGFGWLGFVAWMMFACVFSTWPGGSTTIFVSYVRTSLPILALTAGFVVSWRDCERVMYWVAAGGIVNVLSSKLFQHDAEGRLSLDFGTVSNSNDLAAHLLLVVPFMLYIVLKPDAKFIFRVINLCCVGGALYMILGTASRGALIALVVTSAVAFLMCSMAQRVGLVVLVAVAAPVLFSALPAETVRRITSFSSSSRSADAEAIASSASREYLLNQSLSMTVHHPVFGVGPGQFSIVVGKLGNSLGLHVWQETHNFFTQIASECGIPALLFYLTALVSSITRLVRVLRRAGRHPQFRQVRVLTFCLLLSITGFGAAGFFLNLAYQFYWLMLTGLAVSVAEAAQREYFDLQTPRPAFSNF